TRSNTARSELRSRFQQRSKLKQYECASKIVVSVFLLKRRNAFGISSTVWFAKDRKRTRNRPVWDYRLCAKLSSNTVAELISIPKKDVARSSVLRCHACELRVHIRLMVPRHV